MVVYSWPKIDQRYFLFGRAVSKMALTKTIAEQIKKYDFGEKCSITLTKQSVRIVDDEKEKSIELPLKRWASFLTCLPEIEDSLNKLRKAEFVKYKEHIGGGWFVSVTTGFPCVDVRRFYMPMIGFEEKATKSGLAIRLREWHNFVAVVHAMKKENPQLAEIQPCGLHHNQEEAMRCAECYPFPSATFGSTAI